MTQIYPNCFDSLTTNGIIADDVMGYITGTPSPYLQNYVAQRGWAPDMPGRMMPDPLPNVQPKLPLPNDVYEKPQIHEPSNKLALWKKIAAGILIAGVSIFAAVKCKNLFSKIRGPKTPKTAAPKNNP